MKPVSLVLSLLLSAPVLAGCLGAGAPPAVVGPAADASSSGGSAVVPTDDLTSLPSGAAPRPHAAAPGELRAIPITGIYSDYPTGAGASCSSPSTCGAVMPFGIHFTGTMAGEAMGIAHAGADSLDPAAPTHVSFTKDPVLFTGSIEGCGSGSLSFVIRGWGTADTGGLYLNETGQFVPGSASEGFAGVADVFWAVKDHNSYPRPTAIEGTAWCR